MSNFGVPVASLFAELGFKIDRQRFDDFRGMLKDLQKDLGDTMRLSANVGKTLGSLVDKLNKISTSFSADSLKAWRRQLQFAAKAYKNAVVMNEKELGSLSSAAQNSARRMAILNGRFDQGDVALSKYLAKLQLVVAELRNLAGARANLPRPGGGYGGGGRPPNPHGGNGAGPRPAGGGPSIWEALGVGAFLRPMLPTGMGIGGMLGGGYAFKELVQTGREMQSMENKLKAVSLGAKSFNDNLEFVKKTSNELAMDVEEFGASYASIFQSTKSIISQKETQQMFTGFNKYFRALQLTPDAVKGSLRAIGQMFNKQQVMA